MRRLPTSPLIARDWLLTVGLVCALAGCRVPEAGLHVVVEGPLQPGEDFDRLSLVAYLAAGRTPLHVEAVEGEALALPATFNLLSGQGTPAGTAVHLLASAERDGQVVSAVRAEGVLLPAEGGRVTLVLPPVAQTFDGGAPVEACDSGADEDGDGLADCADPDCAGRSCGPGGMTCAAGACGCGGAPLGVWKEPLTGFVPREGVQVAALSEGPRAGWLAIVGGSGQDATARGEVELFRPVINQVELVQLQLPRRDVGLAELSGGRLVLAGGVGSGGMLLQDLEVLEFGSTGAEVTRVAFSPALAAAPGVALAAPDALLLTGGTLEARLVRVELAGADWEELASLAAPRSAAAALGGGRRVLAGGPNATATVDVLHPDGGVVSGPPLPVEVAGAAVARTGPGRVLVVGGPRAFLVEDQGGAVSLRETGGVPVALASPRAVALQDGWVYVQDTAGSAAFWFDPAAGAFVEAAALPSPRQGDALGASGRSVYRFGGRGQAGLDGLVQVLERRCPGS